MAGILQDLYGGCDVVFPTLGICNDKGLMRYETYYKMLDLYHQFSNRLGKKIDVRRLDAAREKTELSIMQALAKNKKNISTPVNIVERHCPSAMNSGFAMPATRTEAGFTKNGFRGIISPSCPYTGKKPRGAECEVSIWQEDRENP